MLTVLVGILAMLALCAVLILWYIAANLNRLVDNTALCAMHLQEMKAKVVASSTAP